MFRTFEGGAHACLRFPSALQVQDDGCLALTGLGPDWDRTQGVARSSLCPGLPYLGPLGLEGVEGFWLLVEGPLPLATSTQLSTFHFRLAPRSGPLGLKRSGLPQTLKLQLSTSTRETRRSGVHWGTTEVVPPGTCHSPMSSFQTSGLAAMNWRIRSRQASLWTSSSSTPRDLSQASSPRKVSFSPMTTLGIP